jgi:[acyl-carrier-protein] S-malonyltransferase
MMQPMQARMEPLLKAATFNDLQVPLVTNVDAEIISKGAEARDALVRQLTLPVRWEESIRELIDKGATSFVEVGPGRVLCGLLRQIDRSVHSMNVEDEATLRSAQTKLAAIRAERGDN